jgi:hypothetical protein
VGYFVVSQLRSRTFGVAARAAGQVNGVPISGALLAVILGLGVHVNLSPSARRLHWTVTGSPHSGDAGRGLREAGGRAPGRVCGSRGPALCAAGVQPVVAVAGDVVEYRLGGCAAGSSLSTSRIE